MNLRVVLLSFLLIGTVQAQEAAPPRADAIFIHGNIYTGVNVEISSYGLTLCAERSALAAAISNGAGPVTQVAVACIDVPPQAGIAERMPCGACRQWLADLAPNAVIYIDGVEQDFSVADLLPYAFEL